MLFWGFIERRQKEREISASLLELFIFFITDDFCLLRGERGDPLDDYLDIHIYSSLSLQRFQFAAVMCECE